MQTRAAQSGKTPRGYERTALNCRSLFFTSTFANGSELESQMETLLKLPEVLKRTGIGSKPNLYAKMARGEFPHSVRIGGRAVAWPESRVQQWIDAAIAAADADKEAA